MNASSTHKFPRLLPGLETIPPSRGSPRGCSEDALSAATRKRGPA
jgi:hypothetical protein